MLLFLVIYLTAGHFDELQEYLYALEYDFCWLACQKHDWRKITPIYMIAMYMEQPRAVENKGGCGVSLYIRDETKSWFIHRIRRPIYTCAALCVVAQYNLNGKSVMDSPCIEIRSCWSMQRVIYAPISLSITAWDGVLHIMIKLLPLSYRKSLR